MKRRQINVAISSIALGGISASVAANPFAISLFEAFLAIGRSVMSFLIKEAVPAVAKNTFMRSMAVSAVAGLAVAEAYAQVHKQGAQSAQSAKKGGAVLADLFFINSLDMDIDTTGSDIALIDSNSGRVEMREPFDSVLLMKKRSASKLLVQVARLPAEGNKQLIILANNQIIGSSAIIMVS